MSYTNPNRVIAIDCENIRDINNVSMLARVSIVNKNCEILMDKYVRPTNQVGDYLTWVSGITERHLRGATGLPKILRQVNQIINYADVIVGHTIHHDLRKCNYERQELVNMGKTVVDICTYFQKNLGVQRPSLKRLAATFLGKIIQRDSHDSVVDAVTTMELYLQYMCEPEPDPDLVIAIDCECTLDVYGRLMLAKVSIVNKDYDILMDKYVLPTYAVGNYCGIPESNFRGGATGLKKILKQINQIVDNADVIVGHSVHHILKKCHLDPQELIADGKILEDTCTFFRNRGVQRPSFNYLATEYLNTNLPDYHDSVVYAITTMGLYKLYMSD